MGDEVKKDSAEENKADEIPRPAELRISSSRIGIDGKRIYFDVSMDGKKLGEIWISKDEREKDGEKITIVKAKLIPSPALKDLTEEIAKPVECRIKKDEDLSERVGKCFEGMGSVFEGIVGKDVYIDGKFVSGREVLAKFITNAAANWDRYLDDLKEMMRERARKAGGRKSRKGIYVVERALARIYKKDPEAVWLAISYYAAAKNKKFPPTLIAKILKDLYDQVGDGGSIVDRAAILVKAYKETGVDLSQYREELEKILETSLDEIERRAGEIKITVEDPKRTLIDVVERVPGVERSRRALRIIARFFGDLVMKKIRDSRRLRVYVAADLLRWRTLVIKIIRNKAGEVIDVDEIEVLSGAPEEIYVIKSRFSNIFKYRIVWRNPVLGITTYGPDLLDMIVNRIIADGHAVRKDDVRDVINNIIMAYTGRGLAKVMEEEIKGFVFDKETGRVKASMIDIKEPTLEELKKVKEFIDTLYRWYSGSITRLNALGVILKWSPAAAFAWVYKEMGRGETLWSPHLCGESYTGKTTLGLIGLAIWGRGREHLKSWSSYDNFYRLGEHFSNSTLPWGINEADPMINNEIYMSVLNDALMGFVFRSKQISHGVFGDIPSLSLPIVISQRCANVKMRRQYARRLRCIEFTREDIIPPEKREEFEREVIDNLKVLEAVGRFAANYVIKNGIKESFDNLGLRIWEEIYKTLGEPLPSWIRDAKPPSLEEIYRESDVDVREIFRRYIVRKIADMYYKGHSKEVVREVEQIDRATGTVIRIDSVVYEPTIDKMVEEVIEDRLITWLIKLEDKVAITTAIRNEEDFPEELEEHGGIKGLAEILGWEYKTIWIYRGEGERDGMKAMVVEINRFINFLRGRAKEEDDENKNPGEQGGEKDRERGKVLT
jgi:hypothetical protein